jgi:molecular chaperone DnaK (HSP70)
MLRYPDNGVIEMEQTSLPDSPVCLGIDFGENTTVIASGDTAQNYPTIKIEGISRTVPDNPAGTDVHQVPSLIHYEKGCVKHIGYEVVSGDWLHHPSTVRRMRRYLLDNSPVQVPAGDGRMVRCRDAAGEFLTRVISRTIARYPGGASVVFALPANAPPDYPQWLDRISRAAGARSCSWVHESFAAAVGYGITPEIGEQFILISFTETELTASVVMREDTGTGQGYIGMRTLSQASFFTGCQVIDTWIIQDLFKRFRILESEPRAERIRPHLIKEVARAREHIALEGLAEIKITDPLQGRIYTVRYGIAELTRLLDEHRLIPSLQQILEQVISARRPDNLRIAAVLLIGPGGSLPGIVECLRNRFPSIPVHTSHILDAIARGAAAGLGSNRVPDRITRTYALRYWDPVLREHHYRFLVHCGTRFPSQGQVARITISAAYDGQTHLGLPLWEIAGDNGKEGGIELVSDMAGGIHLAGPVRDANAKNQAMPVNQRELTLLTADPPAKKGEPRFECTFTIDSERCLCLSARDLLTGKLVKLNTQVCRMK